MPFVARPTPTARQLPPFEIKSNENQSKSVQSSNLHPTEAKQVINQRTNQSVSKSVSLLTTPLYTALRMAYIPVAWDIEGELFWEPG